MLRASADWLISMRRHNTLAISYLSPPAALSFNIGSRRRRWTVEPMRGVLLAMLFDLFSTSRLLAYVIPLTSLCWWRADAFIPPTLYLSFYLTFSHRRIPKNLGAFRAFFMLRAIWVKAWQFDITYYPQPQFLYLKSTISIILLLA